MKHGNRRHINVLWVVDHLGFKGKIHGAGRYYLNVIPSFDDCKYRVFLCVLRAKVVKSYPETVFLIVGDGPLRGQLEELVLSLGLEETALLVPPGDYFSLAKKIIYLIENPGIKTRLALNAYEESNKYSTLQTSKRFGEIYSLLLRSGFKTFNRARNRGGLQI
jgi:hypothetical protein